MNPSVGIIIVNWNSYVVTSACLTSLRDCTYSDYEVILVDNGSNDHSGDQLKQDYPEITLIKNSKNLGFTGGNNRGIEYALESQKELIMLLNNDTIVTPDFIAPLIEAMHADSDIGAIQPKIMFNQERDIIWNAGSKYSKLWSLPRTIGVGEKDVGQFDNDSYIPWVTGCCFLVSAEIVRKVGLLNDRFFIYYEDTDWSFRMVNAGYRLAYCPKSKIYHEVGKSNDNRDSFGEGTQSPFTHFIAIRNHIYISRMYATGINKITSFMYQLFKITGYSTYFLFKGRFRKLKASFRGFYRGYTNQLTQA